MNHATVQQYLDALRDPAAAFAALRDDDRDADLRDGRLDPACPPALPAPGGALVCKFVTPRRTVALRFFVAPAPGDPPIPEDIEGRYRALGDELRARGLDRPAGLFAEVSAPPCGIAVPGVGACPCVVLGWVEGRTLMEELARRCPGGESDAIGELARRWRAAMAQLAALGIAHGDLAGNNIMVREADGSLVLVDYDFVYIAPFGGRAVGTGFQRGYQHPAIERGGALPFDARMDFFPALVIYATLLALRAQPRLWTAPFDARGRQRRGELLFSARDIADPDDSELLKGLEAQPEPDLARVLLTLREARWGGVDDLAPLEQLLARVSPPPRAAFTAWTRDGTLRCRWVPTGTPPEMVAVCWHPDDPTAPAARVAFFRLWEWEGGEKRVGPTGFAPEAWLTVRLFAAQRRPDGQWIVPPGAPTLTDAVTARPYCRVRVSLARPRGTPDNWLTVETVGNTPLPPLVAVRKTGGLPTRALGHARLHGPGTLDGAVGTLAPATVAWVPLDIADYPANTVVRVFPQREDDRHWIAIEPCDTRRPWLARAWRAARRWVGFTAAAELYRGLGLRVN